MTDSELTEHLRNLYEAGCPYLAVYSRRQDIVIARCERGVLLGLLRFEEIEIDDQETHWRYHFTDDAKKLWQGGA